MLNRCPKCGAQVAEQPFDSWIRRLYVCANGHSIVTLVDPRGVEEVLGVSDER